VYSCGSCTLFTRVTIGPHNGSHLCVNGGACRDRGGAVCRGVRLKILQLLYVHLRHARRPVCGFCLAPYGRIRAACWACARERDCSTMFDIPQREGVAPHTRPRQMLWWLCCAVGSEASMANETILLSARFLLGETL